ncbi:hypothetical protein BTN50_0364 [Candidatus Enterovibrio altilux]|uniref:Uncharacterized protein n=1 Tax=Candidatus Enterovibrio altilux TaxID=1927128 RepID=A0A291B7B4_9GAMM|nr:hypothetical protein BTN50_0364 [Candidatus Enterovibrio luxaltus]
MKNNGRYFFCSTVLVIMINIMLSLIAFSYWHLILAYPFALLPLLMAAET